jgi:hypothetical protein
MLQYLTAARVINKRKHSTRGNQGHFEFFRTAAEVAVEFYVQFFLKLEAVCSLEMLVTYQTRGRHTSGQ